MAVKATKIVIYFEDGSKWEMNADEVGSIFLKQSKAEKCGHKPPYKKPPKPQAGSANATTLAAMSATSGESGGEGETSLQEGGGCYIIGGVIVCP